MRDDPGTWSAASTDAISVVSVVSIQAEPGSINLKRTACLHASGEGWGSLESDPQFAPQFIFRREGAW
jgi:hypothetical protein